jgi:hypothetical protein
MRMARIVDEEFADALSPVSVIFLQCGQLAIDIPQFLFSDTRYLTQDVDVFQLNGLFFGVGVQSLAEIGSYCCKSLEQFVPAQHQFFPCLVHSGLPFRVMLYKDNAIDSGHP